LGSSARVLAGGTGGASRAFEFLELAGRTLRCKQRACCKEEADPHRSQLTCHQTASSAKKVKRGGRRKRVLGVVVGQGIQLKRFNFNLIFNLILLLFS
jgi:hypothetical protein